MTADPGNVWSAVKKELGPYRRGMLFEPRPGVIVDVQARSAFKSDPMGWPNDTSDPTQWVGSMARRRLEPDVKTFVWIYHEDPSTYDRAKQWLFDHRWIGP